MFPWIEYSVTTNRIFCFPCRVFPTSNRNPNDKTTFVNDGFCNWKKALQKDAGLRLHDHSAKHKDAVVQWQCYKQIKTKGDQSFSSQLSEAHKALVQENRYCVKTVAEVLLFTARQCLAQRGHAESQASLNHGNFLELMSLIKIQKMLKYGPKTATYTHSSIQNELVSVMANIVREKIRSEIETSECFALIVDERYNTLDEMQQLREEPSEFEASWKEAISLARENDMNEESVQPKPKRQDKIQ
ncbi:UNVERIFIED_CONTAM: hypothetical protein FKN15_061565 [Acipenser sinensis]